MDIDFDGAYLLYGLGILLGIFSIFYFGFEILLNLSPVTKAVLLLFVSASFMAAGLRFPGLLMSISFYLLGGFSYLAFVAYTLARFGFSEEVDFLLLAVSSALFLGLGYMVRERGFEVDHEGFRKFLGATIFLGLALSAVDVAGQQPAYDLELEEEVNLSTGESRLGTVRVENGFFLHRDTDLPQYSACLQGEDRIFVRMDGEPGLLVGGASAEVDLTVRVPRTSEGDLEFEGIHPVERSDRCPENPERGTVYVFEDRQRYD